MAERDIRSALKKRVEEYGGEIRAVSWLGRRHAPDVLCLFPHDSRFAEHWFGKRKKGVTPGTRKRVRRSSLIGELHPFIETKAPGGKPNPGQAREHERMRAAGCTVLVISTLEQLDEWLPPL